jgi:hypothetical protein
VADVRLLAPHPGYIDPREVRYLAASLRRRGLDVEIEKAPDNVRYSAPWDVIVLYLDKIAEAKDVAVAAAVVVAWARRRWRRLRGKHFNSDHLVLIYGPDGKILKRIYLDDDDPRELKSERDQREAMNGASEKNRNRTLGPRSQ